MKLFLLEIGQVDLSTAGLCVIVISLIIGGVVAIFDRINPRKNKSK